MFTAPGPMAFHAASIFILIINLVLAGGGWAQDCAWWTDPAIEPVTLPAVNGSLCEIQGNRCFVGGDYLWVVDITRADGPDVLGSLALPSPMVAMAADGDLVFLTCTSGDVYSVDTGDPGALALVHRYHQADLSRLVRYREWLVVQAGEGQLHFLDVSGPGPAVLDAVVERPGSIHELGASSRFLFLNEAYQGLVLDASDPTHPIQVGQMTDSVGDSWYADRFVVLEDRIYFTLAHPNLEPDGGTTLEYTLVGRQLNQAGLGEIFLEFHPDDCDGMAASDEGLLLVKDDSLALHEPFTGERVAAVQAAADLEYSLGSAGVCAVSESEGLLVWDRTVFPFVRPLATFAGEGYLVGETWVSLQREYLYGGAGSGTEVYYTWSLTDLSDPATPTLAAEISRHWNSSTQDIDVRGVPLGDRWLCVWYSSMWGADFELFDTTTGMRVAQGEGNPQVLADGKIWGTGHTDGEYWICSHDLDEGGAVSGLQQISVEFPVKSLQVHGHHLLAVDRQGVAVWDISDPANPAELSRFSHLFDDIFGACWDGADFYCRPSYSSGDVLHMDWQDVANPAVETVQVPVPGESYALDGLELMEGALFLKLNGGDGSGDAGMILELTSEGDFAEFSGPLPGEFSGALRCGDFLYLSESHGVELHDISTPVEPRRVGKGLTGGRGDLALLDGYLVAGGSVLLPDCRATGQDQPVSGDPALEGMPSRPDQLVSRIHPNPFNPRTTVSFLAPGSQRVRVQVFDLRGRLVADLADRVFPAGKQMVTWDGRDGAGQAASSGEYVFRIAAGWQVETRKALLLR